MNKIIQAKIFSVVTYIHVHMYDLISLVCLTYRISSKCRRTSKSCHPQNVAAYFSHLIPIMPPSKSHCMLRVDNDMCMHTRIIRAYNRLITEARSCVHACVSISADAALELSPHMVQHLEIKSHCGEISRKYGMP